MKTKTASVRLPKEMFEEIDNICDGVGCSRNDWIKDTLQDKLREENSQDQEEPKKPQLIKVEDVIEFECKNQNLYENGSLFGSCSDYDLKQGKVYEKNGKYLGQIKNDSKPQLVEILEPKVTLL